MSKSKMKAFNKWSKPYTINGDPKTKSRSQGGAVVNVSASGVAGNVRTAEFMNKASHDTSRSNKSRLTSAKLQVKHMLGAAMGRAEEKKMKASRKKRDKAVNKKSKHI